MDLDEGLKMLTIVDPAGFVQFDKSGRCFITFSLQKKSLKHGLQVFQRFFFFCKPQCPGCYRIVSMPVFCTCMPMLL